MWIKDQFSTSINITIYRHSPEGATALLRDKQATLSTSIVIDTIRYDTLL